MYWVISAYNADTDLAKTISDFNKHLWKISCYEYCSDHMTFACYQKISTLCHVAAVSAGRVSKIQFLNF